MDGSWDVIVVGAGTAGSVLAERLTASGRLRVAVVEAGWRPTHRFVAIPAGFTRLFRSELDWAFESEPQTAVGGRRIYTPRGRMLGGSANLNAQMHQWGHPADFDGWAAAGATGWSWEEVAPVFRSQECWLGEDGDAGRGRSGPMVVSPNRHALPVSHAFVETARRCGFGDAPHYNGHAYEGAWIAELTQSRGRRFSAYHAYLEPAMARRNLDVLTGTHALQVVIEGGRAAGVRVRRAGVTRRLGARGVVLAAGAFGSPQLLLLSGVGPGEELARMGLPVHRAAPEVGRNLQDHPVEGLVFRARGTPTFARADSLANVLRYLLGRRGMLASNGIEGFAFTRVHPDARAPDLEILFYPLERREQFLEPPQQDAFGLAAAVVAPRSRGRVTLAGPDPLAPPRIDFAVLSDPDGVDASVLWEGLRRCRRIAATAPLAAYNAGEMAPGPDVETDAELRAYASRDMQTVYHPTSTCRMGSDAGAVVDPRLAVRGVDALWVADASVMPTVPRGHPNAAVAMIATRASAWIEAALRDAPEVVP